MASFSKTLHPGENWHRNKQRKTTIVKRKIAVVKFHMLYCICPTFAVRSICRSFSCFRSIDQKKISARLDLVLMLCCCCLLLPKLPRMCTGRGVSCPSWSFCPYAMKFLVFVNKSEQTSWSPIPQTHDDSIHFFHFFFCSVLPSFVLPAVDFLAPRSQVSGIGVWKWITSEIMVTTQKSRRRRGTSWPWYSSL